VQRLAAPTRPAPPPAPTGRLVRHHHSVNLDRRLPGRAGLQSHRWTGASHDAPHPQPPNRLRAGV